MNKIQTVIKEFIKTQNNGIWIGVYIVLTVLYFAYFGYAMYFRYGDEGSVRLLVVTVLATVFIVARLILKQFGEQITCTSWKSIGFETKRKFFTWYDLTSLETS